MTPSPLEEAAGRVRAAAKAITLATHSGRVELRTAGAVAPGTWTLAEHLGHELEERLGELERAERSAGLR